MISMIARRGSQSKTKTLFLATGSFVCVLNILVFSKKSEYETYKHCMITNTNNKSMKEMSMF